MPASFGAQLRERRAAATLPPASTGSTAGTTVQPVSTAPGQGVASFPVPGPAGPLGGSQTFEFDTPSSEWTVVHGLGRTPMVVVYDLEGNLRPLVPVIAPDENTLVLTPTPPLAGKVVVA